MTDMIQFLVEFFMSQLVGSSIYQRTDIVIA